MELFLIASKLYQLRRDQSCGGPGDLAWVWLIPIILLLLKWYLFVI